MNFLSSFKDQLLYKVWKVILRCIFREREARRNGKKHSSLFQTKTLLLNFLNLSFFFGFNWQINNWQKVNNKIFFKLQKFNKFTIYWNTVKNTFFDKNTTIKFLSVLTLPGTKQNFLSVSYLFFESYCKRVRCIFLFLFYTKKYCKNLINVM